jgi:hypothetical protein
VPKAKHPYSVLVWGGISKKGATKLAIFNGIMKAPFFQESILGAAFKPFVDEHYPDHHRLFQDNDPKHTARTTRQYMEDNGINWWKSPASSPDINPIENLWHEMKLHICKNVKPKTKDELIAGVLEFWETVDEAKCRRYIDHMKVVIPKVVEVEGRASGY